MDIIYVAYNSEKWIDRCFSSLLRSTDFNLKEINVYVVDNASTD
ncbi:MAG TPA: glycosyltransferase, partial [Candidatus Blautia excrementigallinarum]|nr:glycosyltransferase [Candidatus Blautia excrementigallinarum]